MGKPAVDLSLLSDDERLDLLDRLWDSSGEIRKLYLCRPRNALSSIAGWMI